MLWKSREVACVTCEPEEGHGMVCFWAFVPMVLEVILVQRDLKHHFGGVLDVWRV